MALAGSRPRNGIYKCIICDHLVKMDDSQKALPLCPKCDGISFIGKRLEPRI